MEESVKTILISKNHSVGTHMKSYVLYFCFLLQSPRYLVESLVRMYLRLVDLTVNNMCGIAGLKCRINTDIISTNEASPLESYILDALS